MKRVIMLSMIVLFLIFGCTQKQTKPVEVTQEQPTAEEQKPTCTEMWICQNENTKAYRRADCTFEQITNCPAGCENGDCKEVKVTEQPKLEPKKEEPKKETKESCTIGWKCLDNKRLGYQSSNCVFEDVQECQYGCKDNACITTAPPEEEKEETFSLQEGNVKFGVSGWKYSDFSKNQTFQNEVYEQDLKIKLYATASSYNYFRAESYRADIWLIGKGIKEATRADCIANRIGANAYASLRSGQTLCIQTREGNIALIGGYWEGVPTETTELSWKYYS